MVMSEFSLNNMLLLTVNATSCAAWCYWWLCNLADGKLQKMFHS